MSLSPSARASRYLPTSAARLAGGNDRKTKGPPLCQEPGKAKHNKKRKEAAIATSCCNISSGSSSNNSSRHLKKNGGGNLGRAEWCNNWAALAHKRIPAAIAPVAPRTCTGDRIAARQCAKRVRLKEASVAVAVGVFSSTSQTKQVAQLQPQRKGIRDYVCTSVGFKCDRVPSRLPLNACNCRYVCYKCP